MTLRIRVVLIAAVTAGAVTGCGTSDAPDHPTTTPATTTAPYSRIALANPCDAVPAELFVQQQLERRTTVFYPDNDPTIPDSATNGCSVVVLPRGGDFDLAVTNRSFDWVQHLYGGYPKPERVDLEGTLEGRRAAVNQTGDNTCRILIEIPGGTLKMSGVFTSDSSLDTCKRGVELAKSVLPYIKVSQQEK